MHRWVDHTSELELEIEAASEAAVYEQALLAIAGVLGDECEGPETIREMELAAPERAVLLAEFLGELAFLAETAGFVPAALERLDIAPHRLRVAVRGHTGSPPHLIKAVTYHRLSFEATDGGWRARVVLDV